MNLMHRLQKRLAIPRRESTADLQAAVDAFNRDHGRDWGRTGGTCPVCGHQACFGKAGGKLAGTGRWACFSANHSNVGRKLGACHHGDALDVEAHKAGRDRVSHLRAAGYLQERARTGHNARERAAPATDTPKNNLGHPGRLTRADVVAALGREPDEYERDFLQERAAVMHVDGGLDLDAAEHAALRCLLRASEREKGARHAK